MSMFINSFSNQQLVIFGSGLLLIIASVILFFMLSRRRTAIVLLVSGGLLIKLFMVQIDPYVNMWDEQFHTLVAKNMMQEPLKPMLYSEPVLDYDYKSWVSNHVWLHKQPLFLWQMALSMKIFGVSAPAARLPSALLAALMILLIYLTGRRWFNETAAFAAAVLFATGNYINGLVAGIYHTDHNDVAFIFYVSASLWAWSEYHFSRRRIWLIAIGALAGGAILNKWLTGFFVYLVWGVALLSDSDARKKLRAWADIAISVGIALIISIPWQVYTFIRFPAEAKWESHYNALHLHEAVEGHSGDFWYHINQIPILYGQYMNWLIVIAVLVFAIRSRNAPLRNALLVSCLFVYSFFGLAATKMPAFTLMLALPVYLLLGYVFSLVQHAFGRFKMPSWIPAAALSALLLLTAAHVFNHRKVLNKHGLIVGDNHHYREIRTTDHEIFRNLHRQMPPGKFVLFNCRQNEHVQIMFETDYIAYDRQVQNHEIEIVQSSGYEVAVFNDYKLPDYITSDSSIFIIESGMWPPN